MIVSRRVLSAVLMLSSITIGVVHGLSLGAPPTPTTAAMKAQELQDDLDDNGAMRFCEIGPTRFGRGLVATRDLDAGEVVLRIPISRALIQPDLGESDHWAGRLAMDVMNRQRSENCAYANALPEPPSVPSRGDWPESFMKEFDDVELESEVEAAMSWRYEQWEKNCGCRLDRKPYLDALDLVCSRTIRCGKDLMLVPLLDMANHASQAEGGGYYKLDGANICLVAGDRGVKLGEEVTLDYGHRQNKDWILHYGFLPSRNTIERVTLPESGQKVTLQDGRDADDCLRQECNEYLQTLETTLEDDILTLRDSKTLDDRLRMALEYRIARKTILSAVAGSRASTPFSSAFASSLDLVAQ